MKTTLLLFLIVGINLLMPSGGLNLPYLISLFLILKFSLSKVAVLVSGILILADVLNLRPLGVSLFLVASLGLLGWFFYTRFLPHNRIVFVLSVIFFYFITIKAGQFIFQLL